jgi:hypothetical protein
MYFISLDFPRTKIELWGVYFVSLGIVGPMPKGLGIGVVVYYT